jgi:hypothetical protein
MAWCSIACQLYLQLTVIICLVIIPILVRMLRNFIANYKAGGAGYLSVNTSGAGVRKGLSSGTSNISPSSYASPGWPPSPPRPAYSTAARAPTVADTRAGNVSIPRSRSPIAAYDQI